ncbi:MAG: C25 family cysteine peptidase [Planctomycetota bacterium]
MYRRFLQFSFFVWLILAGQTTAVRAQQADAVEVVGSSSQNLSLRIRLPNISASDMLMSADSPYTQLVVPGGSQFEVGKPDIPVLGEWVLVPNGTTLSISVDPGRPVVFENVDIPPVQPPMVDAPGAPAPQFTMDALTYSTDADYPGVFAEAEPLRNVRGQDCTIVRLYPYQYNPVTRQLSVYTELSVELKFDGDIRPVPVRLASRQFETMLKRLAVNADAVLSAQRQMEQCPNRVANLYSTQSNTTINHAGNGQTGGCDYLIICDPAFESAADTLAGWKRLSGFRTNVATTSETGATAAEIKSYIDKSQQDWLPAPSYVLLLGDAEYIPCFYELEHASDLGRTDDLTQGKVASDRYYGDTNDDGIADLFVGRLPVDTAGEAQTAVDRIISYERAPPDQAAAEFYTSFAAIAYFEDDSPRDGYADNRFVATSEDVCQYLLDAGYDGMRIYSHDAGVNPTNWSTEFVFENDEGGGRGLPDHLLTPDFGWDGSTESIANAVNNGVFLVTYRGHGSRFMRSIPRGWSYIGGWIQPEFREDDVAALVNGPLTPIVLSTTCMTGWFDNETDREYEMYSNGSVVHLYESEPEDECLCEQFIINPNGGAVGVIGATRVSYSGRNDRLLWGWMDAVWPDFTEYHGGTYGDSTPLYQMGPVFEYGKQYMLTKYSYEWDYTKTTIDEYVWFGDPTMEIRTGVPQPLTAGEIVHPSAINMGRPTDVTASVRRDQMAVPGARVTISRADAPDDYWTDLTDESGTVTFADLTTTQRGRYDIVVTAHNCLPYEGTIASEAIGIGAITVERQVSSSTDDGYASDAANQNLDADFLAVGSATDHSSPYHISGTVFRNVDVPRGAEIIAARLKVRAYNDRSEGIVHARIQAEATDDAAGFDNLRHIGSQPTTAASVNWEIDEPWLADMWYESPDISDLIREVVNRQGWSADNSLAFFISTAEGGLRYFSSCDRGGGYAPRLQITYAVKDTYVVSGTVTFDGSGLPGVHIEGFPDSVFTDENGYYSTEVEYGWPGRVAPLKDGYVFYPAWKDYSGVTSHETCDYTAAVRTYNLSGHILASSGLGISGVTVSADNSGGSTTTDPDGYYSLAVTHGWSGRIRPERAACDFSPSYLDYVNVTSDRMSQDYTVQTYAISGCVRASDGSPVSGVTISAPNAVRSETTDSAGYYSVTVPHGWSGDVTLSRIGYVFDPAYTSYAGVTYDWIDQNYTATTQAHAISGYVRTFDGLGMSGVIVSADNDGGSTGTAATGYYRLVVPHGWSGRVTPSRTGAMFAPAYRDYLNVTAELTDRNYTRAQTHTISGCVRAEDGEPIQGVTVSADNGGGSGTTDSAGFYSLTVLHGWSGRTVASKTGYIFSPVYREYENVTYNRTNRNYSGEPSDTS